MILRGCTVVIYWGPCGNAAISALVREWRHFHMVNIFFSTFSQKLSNFLGLLLLMDVLLLVGMFLLVCLHLVMGMPVSVGLLLLVDGLVGRPADQPAAFQVFCPHLLLSPGALLRGLSIFAVYLVIFICLRRCLLLVGSIMCALNSLLSSLLICCLFLTDQGECVAVLLKILIQCNLTHFALPCINFACHLP